MENGDSTKMNEKTDVLFLPLQRYFWHKGGSELYATNQMFIAIRDVLKCKAYVGHVWDEESRRKIEEMNWEIESFGIGRDRSVLNDIKFYFDIFVYGAKNAGKARILHHYGAFGYMEGFNPAFFLPKFGTKYIVGPIITPSVDEINKLNGKGGQKDQTNNVVALGFLKVNHRYGPLFSSLLKILHYLTLRRADLIIYESDQCRNLYWGRFPQLKNRNSQILPFSIASETEFKPNKNRRSYEGNLCLGVASNLIRRKNIDKLIDAFPSFEGRVELKITSTGPEIPRLVKMVNDEGIFDNVKFLGRIPAEQIRSFYNSIDVYVSLDDLKGVLTPSVVEALMSGCPVVIADSRLGDEIRVQAWGVTVNPLSRTSIVKGVNYFIQNAKNLAAMSTEARRFAEINLSTSSFRIKLMNIYGNLGISNINPL